MSVNRETTQRVITVEAMPPEKLAYALARYSRSPDSIHESLEWVRTHDSSRFLESFYFQYGHSSIADLGHLAVCFEGISEAAAIEIEDEQLWDGQARSSRYQDFANAAPVVPPELSYEEAELYRERAGALLEAYREVHVRTLAALKAQLPRPEAMKPEAYERNLRARAFDVARYLLPLGIPTGVGQVTSIRTLEGQIRRMRASEFAEVRELAEELARACSRPAMCRWRKEAGDDEPVAPTLARHAERDAYAHTLRAELSEWAAHHVPATGEPSQIEAVQLTQPADTVADLCATLLFPVTRHSYRDLYRSCCDWNEAKRRELLQLAVRSRGDRDELPRHFRSAPFAFDFVMDLGSYRDFHRHRRCQQFRQYYTFDLGYDAPPVLDDCGVRPAFELAMESARAGYHRLPDPARQYLLPFGARSRFLFKMDFAELEYVSRLRSGIKGHFAYRKIAWDMKVALGSVHPDLGTLIQATPPEVEDPLTR